MDRAWLRVLFALLLLLGVGKALRDLSIEASSADDVTKQPTAGALFDFRDTVWNPGRDLLHGHNPYDHVSFLERHPGTQEFDAYSPSWFALAVPFALLPYHLAQAIWWLTLLAGIALLALLSLRAAAIDVDGWRIAGLTGALLVAVPGQEVMRNGQQAFALACCLLVLWLTWRRLRWAPALCLLVLTSKPQAIIPVLVCLALGLRAWPVVARGVTLVAATAAVPLVALVVAAGGVGDFVRSVQDNLDYSSRTQNDLSAASDNIRVDVLNTLGKLDLARPTLRWQLAVATVMLALAVVALRRVQDGSALQLAVVATVTVAALPHYSYDFAFFVPVVVMFVAGARASDRVSPAVRWSLTAALVLPMLQVYQVDRALDRFGMPSGLRQSIGSLCVLAAFVITMIAVMAPAAVRQVAEDGDQALR